jgi:molecular chaperone HscB
MPDAFAQDPFALFGLPQRYAIDADALTEAWRRLQGAVHPDRFAAAGAAQQRVALQWSSRINGAYRTLRDPLQRAACLCELRGAPIDAERNTAMPAEFLVQQMDWREQLDDADGDAAALDALARTVQRERDAVYARLGALLDGAAPDAPAASAQVRVLMFIERFHQDLSAQLARTRTRTLQPAA